MRLDGRYTFAREWCGRTTPRWVARFCGKWLGQATTRGSARAFALRHRVAFLAELATIEGGSR